MEITIQQANRTTMGSVSDVLVNAAQWLISKGEPLWELDQLVPEKLEKEPGVYFLATVDGQPAGACRLQEQDHLFWPEADGGEAIYLHRLSVKRSFAGKGIASAIIEYIENEAKDKKMRLLRLDCDATRPKLRSFYEELGFRLHSFSQVGHFSAARYEKELEANKSLQTTSASRRV